MMAEIGWRKLDDRKTENMERAAMEKMEKK